MKNLKSVLFISRNKDNKNIKDFKERKFTFLTDKIESISDTIKLKNQFLNFVNEGQEGEVSRFYVSINDRNAEKINKQLTHYLIDNPETNPAKIMSKTTSIASKIECAVTKKWLFDFDIDEVNYAHIFLNDISKMSGIPFDEIIKHRTKNGYAFIVPHGFDTRELLEKWNKDKHVVEVKRDELLLVDWRTK